MAASLTVQSGVVGLLLLIPLLHPEGPLLRLDVPPVIYRANVMVEPVRTVVSQPVASRTHSVFTAILQAPRSVPGTIATIHDAPELGVPLSGSAAMPGAVMSDIFSPTLPAERMHPVAAVKIPPPPTAPLRVSTSVQSALLKFGPKPLYPPLAKAARVQGSVRLTAVIGADGAIRDLRIISGPPLLVKAALDAVSTWRYQPTLLNGIPVEVITEVDVNFTLSQ